MEDIMRRSSFVSVSVVLSLLFPLAAVHAQDLKAWENATNYMQDDKGCLSIPYSDAQSTCIRKQDEVNKWCKDSGPFNCDSVDPKQLQRQVEKLKTQRDELTTEKTKLDRARSAERDEQVKRDIEARLAKVDAEITALNSSRAVLERQVLDGSRTCKARLDVAKACRDYRANVQEVFSGVRSRANSETDPNVVPLARKLIAWWDERYRRHEEQLSAVKRAVEICEQVLYEIGRLGSF
jgi:uncharacterized protein YPO0396